MIKTVQKLLESLPNKRQGLITVDYDATENQVAAVLKNNIVNLVVVTHGGKPVGVISTSDISNEVAGGHQGRRASEIMTNGAFTVSPDEDITNVSKTMTEKNIRHIVIANNEEWIGILSIKEVLGAVTANEMELEEQLEMYKQSGWPPVS